jgi:hypothetical protein
MVTALLGTALILGTTGASAQDPIQIESTADPVAQEPAGPDASFFDQLRAKGEEIADETQIIERLNGDIDGWYPRLGGMTRGGGFAIGPGYRFHVTDEGIFVDLSAGLSLKGYKALDANVRWLQALDERFELWTDFRHEDFPQEDFFGMGLDAPLEARTSYDFDSSDISVRGLFRPASWVRIGTRVGYLRPEIGPGRDRNYPSVEEIFTDAEAPGLAAQPNFFHTTFFGEIDYRDRPGNPAKGGVYQTSFGIWDDRTLQQFDHRRFDALAVQYVPVVPGGRHVVSGRVGTTYVNNETGERVPFYFLGYVGGVDTIRSYREFRFKDENAIWLGAEYKWTFHEYASLVTFLDAGEVSSDWNDIDLRGLKTGYGFGFRVHTDKMTFARLDFGTGGGEGWQVFLKFSPSF